MWSEEYGDLVNRNIGLLTHEQQNKLKRACVAICGLGGIGGVPSEILARTGIESFKLLDNGSFEPTNSNRQIYSFGDTNRRKKTTVTEEYLKKINPQIQTESLDEITEISADGFLCGVDVVVLGIDSIIPCIVLSRAARRLGIPLVEGWALSFGNVRVFTSETPSLEEVYELPTIGRDVSTIGDEEAKDLVFHSLNHLRRIEGLYECYPDTAIERLRKSGEGTTLAPMVWLGCAMVAHETIKVLLNWGDLALAPRFAVYDGIHHRIPKQEGIDE